MLFRKSVHCVRSGAAPLEMGATVQTELESAPALRPSHTGAVMVQLCGFRLTGAIVMFSMVPDVIASPRGSVTIRWGWESAGSGAIFGGPVDSPGRQERTA